MLTLEKIKYYVRPLPQAVLLVDGYNNSNWCMALPEKIRDSAGLEAARGQLVKTWSTTVHFRVLETQIVFDIE